jgi:hypothetical protein
VPEIRGPVARYIGAGRALVIERINPLTVLRVSFILSAVLGTLTVLACILICILLDATGGFDQLNTMFGSVFGPGPGLPFDLRQYLPLAQVASHATLVAVLNVVLVSGCAPLGAVLYNTAARFRGGAGVSLTDDLPEQSPPGRQPYRKDSSATGSPDAAGSPPIRPGQGHGHGHDEFTVKTRPCPARPGHRRRHTGPRIRPPGQPGSSPPAAPLPAPLTFRRRRR